jgi:hypothetical protein
LISWKTSFPSGSELAGSACDASFRCAARTIDGPAADPAVVWALERIRQRRFVASMHELLMTTFYRTSKRSILIKTRVFRYCSLVKLNDCKIRKRVQSDS